MQEIAGSQVADEYWRNNLIYAGCMVQHLSSATGYRGRATNINLPNTGLLFSGKAVVTYLRIVVKRINQV